MLGRMFKQLLPDRPVDCKILRGPFRGAKLQLNPHCSMRKIFGLYEWELNDWIRRAIPRTTHLFDVGANDGYFSFGCLAAYRKAGIAGKVLGFEPNEASIATLRKTAAERFPEGSVPVEFVNKFVGRTANENTVILDDYVQGGPLGDWPATGGLLKIDVEGAELDVLLGATKLFHAGNMFVIEIHSKELIESVGKLFAEHNLPVELVSQRKHPILGRESRHVDNWWYVSKFS
jgi:hypothetical protein